MVAISARAPFVQLSDPTYPPPRPLAAIFEKLAQELDRIWTDIANNQNIKIAKGQMIKRNHVRQLVAMLPHKKHALC